jgi:hypothetical protein
MGKQQPNDYMRNLALASLAGQAGCVTVVLIFAALFAGLFLDAQLGTRPVFTLGLILMSVPLSLFVMVRLMLSSVSSMNLDGASPEESLTKEKDS